jgi:hypothetical protein
MKTICALMTLTVVAWAAGPPDVKPRFAAADYPSHATATSASLGAHLLTPEQVHSEFATDLNRGYVVVEVAVYPDDGTRLDLGPGDFVLRVAGTDTDARPAAPRTIAAVLQKTTARDRDVTVYPTVGVGYESGRGYDPWYGGRRGGWSTGAGVGVGVGGNRPRPASTEADRKTMELELGDRQLPEKVIAAPVAGYLYFPLAPRKKGTAYVLEYNGGAGRVELPLSVR